MNPIFSPEVSGSQSRQPSPQRQPTETQLLTEQMSIFAADTETKLKILETNIQQQNQQFQMQNNNFGQIMQQMKQFTEFMKKVTDEKPKSGTSQLQEPRTDHPQKFETDIDQDTEMKGTTNGPRYIKRKEPNTFTGMRKNNAARKWLIEIENYLHYYERYDLLKLDSEKLELATSYLTDKAAETWYT
ncbi:MAG: hypothetical protein M1834_001006, partial [Cirrosporium novae-zelandiae]